MRAYDPWPGTYANFNNVILKILNAKVMRLSNKDLLHLKDLISGSIIRLDEFEDIGYVESEKFYKVSKGAMGVVTGDGSVLEIQSVQLPGRKVITAQQLMLNYPEILSLRLT